MADTLDIVVNCDLTIKVPAEELEAAFGSKQTPEIIAQVMAALTPKNGEEQTGAVRRWVTDNEPEFDILGVQGIWS